MINVMTDQLAVVYAMIETIKDGAQVIAILIPREHSEAGICFVTPSDFSLQLGTMTRATGHRVLPHAHQPVRRETVGTQEALFIKSGRVRVDLYGTEKTYLLSRELRDGDVILFASGGHAVTVLESTTIVEVKNGPYVEGADKGILETERFAR
jgi:hypothetical protein